MPSHLRYRNEQRSRNLNMPLPTGTAEVDAAAAELAAAVAQGRRASEGLGKAKDRLRDAQNAASTELAQKLADSGMSDEAVDAIDADVSKVPAVKAARAELDRASHVQELMSDAVVKVAARVFDAVAKHADELASTSLARAKAASEALSTAAYGVQRAVDTLNNALGMYEAAKGAEAAHGDGTAIGRFDVQPPRSMYAARIGLTNLLDGLVEVETYLDKISAEGDDEE